jgi:4-oxalocrotonate tautomerase
LPLIEVSIARGRTPEQLRSLIAALHRAAEETVGAVPENTTVIIREIDHELWSRGNQTIAERNAAAADQPSATPAAERRSQ